MLLRTTLTAFALLACVANADACPFCSATSQTLTEEMDAANAVVLVRLVASPEAADEAETASFEEGTEEDSAGNTDTESGGFGAVDPDSGQAKFEIYEVLKGEALAKVGEQIEVVFFGPPKEGQSFFIAGFEAESATESASKPAVEWTTPLPLSEKAVEYVGKLPLLAAKGGARLKFFQDFLEVDDALLRQDSYDEFARAPYGDLIELKPDMEHSRLVEWISDPDCGPSRRRLYLTMLSVCGDADDLPMLEEMILSDYRKVKPTVASLVQTSLALGGPIAMPLVAESIRMAESRKKLGLDAMIACYLTLAGPEVLDKIDARFLKDPDAEYTHIYSTLMALRFHGEETEVIPTPRLLESVRLLLDHPDFADQVIPDLARWEDWSILDRLTKMFKEAEKRSFIRQPVVTYLVVASEQEGEVGERAQVAIEELEGVDADAVERAKSLMAFGYLGRARPAGDGSNHTRDGAEAEEESEENREESSEVASEEVGAVADMPDLESVGSDELSSKTSTEKPAGSADQPIVDVAPPTPPRMAVILGVPLCAGIFLMALFWLILQRGSG